MLSQDTWYHNRRHVMPNTNIALHAKNFIQNEGYCRKLTNE